MFLGFYLARYGSNLEVILLCIVGGISITYEYKKYRNKNKTKEFFYSYILFVITDMILLLGAIYGNYSNIVSLNILERDSLIIDSFMYGLGFFSFYCSIFELLKSQVKHYEIIGDIVKLEQAKKKLEHGKLCGLFILAIFVLAGIIIYAIRI